MTIPSRTLAVLLACALAATAGCATTGGAPRDASAETTTAAAASVSAFFSWFSAKPTARDESGMYGNTYGPKPELDPDRKISEQDCTKPIVPDGGNLRCK